MDWKLIILGILVAVCGAEIILINTIMVLGNAVYYASSLERLVEGCLYYVAGMLTLGLGCALIDLGASRESGSEIV